MLYMSLLSVVKCLQGDIFFLSLCCGKRQKDNETGVSFWCWDVRGKAVISPVTEETVYSEGQGPPLREGTESCVLYLCAVFLSQLFMVMSRCGDA